MGRKKLHPRLDVLGILPHDPVRHVACLRSQLPVDGVETGEHRRRPEPGFPPFAEKAPAFPPSRAQGRFPALRDGRG